MPEDPNVHAGWAAQTKQIAQSLDQLDYFQVLGLSTDCSFEQLKANFHQLQRNYHPDAFFSSPDAELKEAVHRISKRVAEAYTVLRNPEQRQKYTGDIQGPQRAERLRYNEDSEQEQREEKEQKIAKTAQGRQLWTKAQASVRRGDPKGAIRDLQTALLFEQGNPIFQERIDELKAELGEG